LALRAHFGRRPEKIADWIKLPNPMLGGVAPLEMMEAGRGWKLLAFVKTQMDENEHPDECDCPTCAEAARKALILEIATDPMTYIRLKKKP